MLIAVKKLDIVILKLLVEKGVDFNFTSKGEISGVMFGLSTKIKISKGSNACHCAMASFGRNQS
jgi:hypothetical protein